MVLHYKLDVLVASVRCVPRLHELSREEVSDIFQCVHLISPVIQKCFNATSLTIAVQVRRRLVNAPPVMLFRMEKMLDKLWNMYTFTSFLENLEIFLETMTSTIK